MSEQSGGGPITREQVERAIDQAVTGHFVSMPMHFGGDAWRDAIPDHVRSGYDVSFDALVRALTRWRDELAAAEPVRRVARWDAARGWYALDPHRVNARGQVCEFIENGATAREWGYEIEGGPEPVDDSSPGRLRERREALGWSVEDMAERIRLNASDIISFEDPTHDRSGCASCRDSVGNYAAALSAEEARRAAKAGLASIPASEAPAMDAAIEERWDRFGQIYNAMDPDDPDRANRAAEALDPLPERPAPRFKVRDPYGDGADVDDEPASPPAPERPAPRFKVGDCVRSTVSGKVFEVTGVDAVGASVMPTLGAVYASAQCGSWSECYLEPASPPAPEVVPLDTSGPITIVAPAGLRLVVNGLAHAGSVYRPVDGDTVSVEAWTEAPERAPEVVDVPQPVVKRCAIKDPHGVEGFAQATWTPGNDRITVSPRDIPIALLRAMLEAIDAQQGGAS